MRFSKTLCVFAILFVAATARANVQRYYRFETNAGAGVSDAQAITAADDSSGNNRTGVPYGSPQYGITPFLSTIPSTGAGNNFSFLASNGDGIRLDPDTAPVLGATFTVEAFIRLNSFDPNTGDVKSVIRVGPGGEVFAIGVYNINGSGGTNDLEARLNGPIPAAVFRGDLSVNTNYHVAVTYDGANLRLYFDGALVDSAMDVPGFAGSGFQPGSLGEPLIGGAPFQGNIDELRISDVALSPSQFINAVPEPASFATLFVISAGIIARRRRN